MVIPAKTSQEITVAALSWMVPVSNPELLHANPECYHFATKTPNMDISNYTSYHLGAIPAVQIPTSTIVYHNNS
jgi:hypothetical protein